MFLIRRTVCDDHEIEKLSPNEIKIREEKYLARLRKYIKKEDVFRGIEDILSDNFLLAFIRGRKYNYDKAAKTLYHFVRIRRVDYREYFQNFRPSLIKHGFEVPIRVQGILKSRDPKGRIVGIDRLGIWNPDHISTELGGMLILFYGLDVMQVEQNQREGVVVIIDAAQVSLRHAQCINFPHIRMFYSIYLDSLPLRYREIHVINHGLWADMVLPLVKMFLSKKLRDRITMHSSLESLHAAIPQEILPESLGGPLTDEEAFDSRYEQRILDSEDYYNKLAQKW